MGRADTTAALLAQPDLAARQIRVLLAEAHAILQGDKTNAALRAYGLDSALADAVAALVGTPKDGTRSKMARLDALLSSLGPTLAAAAGLDDAMLGADAVPGAGGPLLSGGVLPVAVSDAAAMSSNAGLSEHMTSAGVDQASGVLR